MSAAIVERLYVWDRVVRLHHWGLASLILANQFLLDGPPHRWAGYAATGFVGVRLVWGFIGSPFARFSRILPSAAQLRHLRGHTHTATRGHNPLGAAMMLTLLGLVLALGATGWLMRTDTFWGASWLEDLHSLLANGLLLCIGLHVLGVIAASLTWRINLPRAMLTGDKTRTTRSAQFEKD